MAIINGQNIAFSPKFVPVLDDGLLENATATAADILKGKTAYGASGKITGTYSPLDTSDATATTADILDGETAYVNGKKIEGTLVPLDTSDATATADDIAEGKTAYVNGYKVIGTSAKKSVDTCIVTFKGGQVTSLCYTTVSPLDGSIISKTEDNLYNKSEYSITCLCQSTIYCIIMTSATTNQSGVATLNHYALAYAFQPYVGANEEATVTFTAI